MKCQNTSCPFCEHCSATICERYVDSEQKVTFSNRISSDTEYVAFSTTNTSSEVRAEFYTKLPDNVAYIN